VTLAAVIPALILRGGAQDGGADGGRGVDDSSHDDALTL
jgi:hypothetical protein